MIKDTIINVKTMETKEQFVENFVKGENNIPINSPLEDKVDTLEEELNLTQSALDYILMSKLNDLEMFVLEPRSMAGYLAMRIIKGMLNYTEVVQKYPELKDEIDSILIAEGRQDLIT